MNHEHDVHPVPQLLHRTTGNRSLDLEILITMSLIPQSTAISPSSKMNNITNTYNSLLPRSDASKSFLIMNFNMTIQKNQQTYLNILIKRYTVG